MKNARFDSERDADKSPADGDARTAGLIHLKPGRISSDKSLKKEVSMHQLIKAMTVAGMVATGLPLLTEAANAQVVGNWNLVRPFSCYTWQTFNPDGSQSTNYMTVTDSTSWYQFLVSDPAVISALFKFCDDGKPFYAWGRPPGFFWNTVYVYPGLN